MPSESGQAKRETNCLGPQKEGKIEGIENRLRCNVLIVRAFFDCSNPSPPLFLRKLTA